LYYVTGPLFLGFRIEIELHFVLAEANR
jgi:hypothetical protein